MDLYKIRNQLNEGKSIYDIPMKVTYYARVSTDKYEQANSLKNQVDYFKEVIESNIFWQYVDGYVDEGISGTSVNKRDAFLKMISDAQKGKFDLIITKEISRFSRNTLDSIKYTQELLSYGVGIIFQTDNINTFYPDAELRLTIMSSIAQEEVRKLSERVKFGFKRSVEKGRVLGNNAIWGYKKEGGRLIIDEQQSEIIRLIFDLYANRGLGIRAVARELTAHGYENSNGNTFGFSTIKSIISNPKYKGYYCGNKTRVVDYRLKSRVFIDKDDWVMYKDEENVPAIVDEEVWERANRILSERSKKVKANECSYQSRYSYSGKIFCAEHNMAYHRAVFRYKNGEKELWQCKEYRKGGRKLCSSPTVYTHELDIAIKEAFSEIIMSKNSVANRLIQRYENYINDGNIKEEINKKQIEIEKICKKKDKMLELLLEGNLTNKEFAERNNKLSNDIKTIELSVSELKYQQEKIMKDNKVMDKLAAIIYRKASLNDDDSALIVGSALEKIVIYKCDDKDRVKLRIYFRFEQGIDYEYSRDKSKRKTHHFVSDVTYDEG